MVYRNSPDIAYKFRMIMNIVMLLTISAVENFKYGDSNIT